MAQEQLKLNYKTKQNKMNELTQKEIQDLLVLLDRVPVTGRAEAIAFLQISQKLEGQLQELLTPKENKEILEADKNLKAPIKYLKDDKN